MKSFNKDANQNGAGEVRKRDTSRDGEAKTVAVAIVSRMILAPALVLPAIAALAVYGGGHQVTDE